MKEELYMTEELFLHQAFGIKTRVNTGKTSYTTEEQKIMGVADAILAFRNGVVTSLDNIVEEQSNKILRPPDQNWQPSDFLPDFSGDWEKVIKEIQEQSRALPDLLLILLGLGLVTEEALPTYQTLVNRPASVRDLTGKQETPWGGWTRRWSAEENRHGDLLKGYLGFNKRVNMRNLERDTQYGIGIGFDPGMGDCPYKFIIYTSFQERATYKFHMGTGRIAEEKGDEMLHTICTVIANDEQRHFTFYREIMREIFRVDPNGAVTAYAWMMRKGIAMPAKELASSKNPNLYDDCAKIAQSIDVYTFKDYAGIIEELNTYWKISEIDVTTVEAAEAQKYLSKLPEKILRVAAKAENKKFEFDASRFDWIKSA